MTECTECTERSEGREGMTKGGWVMTQQAVR
jgi:hypothetical protein